MRPLARLTSQVVVLSRLNCAVCRQRQLLKYEGHRRSFHSSSQALNTAGPSTLRRHDRTDDNGPVIELGASSPEIGDPAIPDRPLDSSRSSTPARPNAGPIDHEQTVDGPAASDPPDFDKMQSSRGSNSLTSDSAAGVPLAAKSTSIPSEWRKTLENHFRRLSRESEKKLTEVGLRINEVTGYNEVERLKVVVADAGE